MDVPIPPNSILDIIVQLEASHSEKQFAEVSDADIILAADAYEYQKNWKAPTRISKIRELGSTYYNFMKVNKGKILVSKHDAEDAQKCAEVLKTDSLTSKYFCDNAFSNVEHLYQLQFSIIDPEIKIGYKGMLDLVMIDHEKKIIYLCDLKTTRSIYTFEDSFYKYRYYLQAAMYRNLLRTVIAEKCPELANYTIAPYRFIVISRSNFKPVVFEWNPPCKLLKDRYNNPLSDWRSLLKQLQWAIDNHTVQLPESWYKSLQQDGVISLKYYV